MAMYVMDEDIYSALERMIHRRSIGLEPSLESLVAIKESLILVEDGIDFLGNTEHADTIRNGIEFASHMADRFLNRQDLTNAECDAMYVFQLIHIEHLRKRLEACREKARTP